MGLLEAHFESADPWSRAASRLQRASLAQHWRGTWWCVIAAAALGGFGQSG